MDDEIYEATKASHYVQDAPPAPPLAALPGPAPPAAAPHPAAQRPTPNVMSSRPTAAVLPSEPGSDQSSVLQQSQLLPSIIENSKAPPLTSVKSTIKAEEPEEEDELYKELRKLRYKKVVAWIVMGCLLLASAILLIIIFLEVDEDELKPE